MPFQVKWIEKALNTTKTLPRLEIDWYAKRRSQENHLATVVCGSLYSTPLLFVFGETFFFLSMLFSWDGAPVKKGFQSSSANWLSSPFFFFFSEENK